MKAPELLRLMPEYRERVWGGRRLAPGCEAPVGEAWIVHDGCRLVEESGAGRTLADLCGELGEALLGRKAHRQLGGRFPLLIKLLDANDWLSVQVHPDDAQAARLEGPDVCGKTEAWHILEAAPGAEVIAGLSPGTSREDMCAALRAGAIQPLLKRVPVGAGDTLFTPAGLIHALGPGLLLYEVQQSSDVTYRVYDWDRPASAGRALHLDQCEAVIDPAAQPRIEPRRALGDGEHRRLADCRYFALDLVGSGERSIELDTRGESFHAVTVIKGEAVLEVGAAECGLGARETALVPARSGGYRLHPRTPFEALVAYVE